MKGVNIVELWEFIQDRLQLLREGILCEFDLSRIKIANSWDFKAWSDDCRRLSLCPWQDYIQEICDRRNWLNSLESWNMLTCESRHHTGTLPTEAIANLIPSPTSRPQRTLLLAGWEIENGRLAWIYRQAQIKFDGEFILLSHNQTPTDSCFAAATHSLDQPIRQKLPIDRLHHKDNPSLYYLPQN